MQVVCLKYTAAGSANGSWLPQNGSTAAGHDPTGRFSRTGNSRGHPVTQPRSSWQGSHARFVRPVATPSAFCPRCSCLPSTLCSHSSVPHPAAYVSSFPCILFVLSPSLLSPIHSSSAFRPRPAAVRAILSASSAFCLSNSSIYSICVLFVLSFPCTFLSSLQSPHQTLFLPTGNPSNQ